MRWIYKLPPRLRSLFRRGGVEQDLSEELRFHLDMQAEQHVARGMGADDARSEALRTFGGVEQLKEECRDSWGTRFVHEVAQDIAFGLRQLRRNPGFASVATLTLALGIGANTAVFSVVDAVLLRPLPYRAASRLVWATERFAFNHQAANVISPDFIGWKDHNSVFEEMGASGGGAGANLTGAGQAARVSITNVTTNFFAMLGVGPVVGRTFLPTEGKQATDHVALVSESLWRSQFGADPRLVGKTIRLDGAAYRVVGVMPAALRFPRADIWTPFALDDASFFPQSPRWAILTVIGRLKKGVGAGQAQADLQLITEHMTRKYPPQAARFRANVRVEVIPLQQLLVRNARSLLLILLGAACFVLLIACANVGNLLLSRGVSRSGELGVRAALGAGRVRLIRQLLIESTLLAATGTGLGFLAGLGTTKILGRLIPPNLPATIRLDPRIFAFVAVVALLTVLLFGLAPALVASRADVTEGLKGGGLGGPCKGSSGGVRRGGNLVSVGEIALSLILLAGAGLLARSFLRLSDVNLGFNPHGLLMATVQRPRTVSDQLDAAFFQQSLERIRALPGVKTAAVTSQYPLGPPHNGTLILNIRGTEPLHPAQVIMITSVSPDYFRAMGMQLLRGRVFDEHDGAGAPPVAIMNEDLARLAFRGQNPLGQRVGVGPPSEPWDEVVGVVSDTRAAALDQEPGPQLFVPFIQQPSYVMTFVLRTAPAPITLAAAVRKTVQGIDKNQPVFDISTMDEIIASTLATRRFRMLLLGMFALLAMTLAMVGIYGVVSYSVAQRAHEIGVRMALGARKGDVLNMVLGQGLKLTLCGLAIGVVGALGLTRFLSSLLYGIQASDPLTFVAVSLILAAVGLLASYIPARRATNVDPMGALRYE